MLAIRLAVIVASLAAFAALAPAALAATPSPRSYLIVPGSSIGGVKIGQSFASGKAAWGARRGRCTEDRSLSFSQCFYRPGNARNKSRGEASFGAFEDRIGQIEIGAPLNGRGENVYTGPLMRFKTSKRIGLGSAIRAFRRSYPRATKARGSTAWEIRVRGAVTSFDFYKGRIAYVRTTRRG